MSAYGGATLPRLIGSGNAGAFSGVIAYGYDNMTLLTGHASGSLSVSATGNGTFLQLIETAKVGGTASGELTTLTGTGEGYLVAIARGAALFQGLRGNASGLMGQVGEADSVLPMLTISTTSHFDISATATATLPMLIGVGTALQEIFTTLVMNTRNTALTEFAGFEFNSYCEFPKGVFLGAGTSGLYQLFNGAETDDGASIPCRLRMGTTDLGEMNKKHVCDGYINYRGDGILEILLEADEQDIPDVTNVIGLGNMQLRDYRFKCSKFRNGRNWRITIQNKDGSSMDVNEIALFYDILTRRV
jgi:hypothetical protein